MEECRNSGYTTLCKNSTGNEWGISFKLNSEGNTKIITYARSVGQCNSCTGTGTIQKGLKATVKGSYESTDTKSPRTLTVTSV